MPQGIRRPLLPGVLLALAACARETPVTEVAGECGDFFQSQVCTWARMQGDSVLAVGATVPVAGIENAPADHQMTWPPAASATLALPAAAQAGSGLTHVTLYWEPMGHPPGPYLTPHFDFHFYTVSQADRTAMDCKDLSKPAALPDGYALPDVVLPPELVSMVGTDTLIGLCVPGMGMHSLPASELTSTEIFQGTIVVGYYGGKPIFVEPMIAKAKMLEAKSFELPIPTVPGMAGNYPRGFRAEFDSTARSYRFTFSAFAPGS